MSASRNVLSALAAAAAVGKVNAAFGSAFSTGPTSDDTFIAESWATLNLPAAPTDNAGDMSLWVGMGTSAGDLIQSIAENYNSDDWSLYAYTLVSTSETTQSVLQAEGSTAAGETAVTFHYFYDAATGNYTQDVIVDGAVISTLSTSSGEALGWGSAVECAAEDCGTVAAHTWTNVSIVLSGAYEGYIDTLALGEGVDATMTSADGGITWEVGTISIPGFDFSTLSVTDDTVDTTTAVASSSTSSGAASSATGSAAGAPSSAAGNESSGDESSDDESSGDESSDDESSDDESSDDESSDDESSDDESSGSPSGTYGAAPSGTATTGAQSSGFPGFGSSTTGSAGAQPSGFGGGSSTWGAPGAQSSSSSGWGGFGGFGGSGGSASHEGSSPVASAGASSGSFGGWARSRISRHAGQN